MIPHIPVLGSPCQGLTPICSEAPFDPGRHATTLRGKEHTATGCGHGPAQASRTPAAGTGQPDEVPGTLQDLGIHIQELLFRGAPRRLSQQNVGLWNSGS